MESITGSSEHEDSTQGECQPPRTTATRLQLSSTLGTPNAQNVHYALARLRLLKRYLSTDERHERIALGLPLKADSYQDLSHQVGAFQSQLGEPTEAQRLAGKAALRRLCGTGHGQEDQAFHQAQALVSELDESKEGKVPTVNDALDVTTALGRAQDVPSFPVRQVASTSVSPQTINAIEPLHIDPGPLIIPWHHSNDVPISEPHKKTEASTISSRETGSLSGTAPTSLGTHELILAEAPGGQDVASHTLKKCMYCGLDVVHCKRTMGCIDAYSTEGMPPGVWDLSLLSQVLSALGGEGRPDDLPYSVASTNHSSNGQEAFPLYSTGSGISQKMSEWYPCGAPSLNSCNASEVSPDFDVGRKFHFDDLEHEIAAALIDEVYKRLAKEGWKFGRTHTGAEQQPDGTEPKSLEAYVSNVPRPALRGHSFRRCRPTSVSELSGGSEEEPPKRLKLGDNSTDRRSDKCIYSCPYWKGNPTVWRYEECTNYGNGWLDISSLKHNHLYAHHDGLKEDKDFFSDEALKKWSGRGPQDRMDLDEKWLAIFKRIFPSWLTAFETFPSPYYDPADTVAKENSRLRSIMRLVPESKPAIVQYLAPTAVSKVLNLLSAEPEEARRPWQPKIEGVILDVFRDFLENMDVVPLPAITRFMVQQHTLSQLSDIMSNARATSDAPPPSEYGQNFYMGGGVQTNGSLMGLDSPWTNPEWFPNGSDFVDSAYESLIHSSGDFAPHSSGSCPNGDVDCFWCSCIGNS